MRGNIWRDCRLALAAMVLLGLADQVSGSPIIAHLDPSGSRSGEEAPSIGEDVGLTAGLAGRSLAPEAAFEGVGQWLSGSVGPCLVAEPSVRGLAVTAGATGAVPVASPPRLPSRDGRTAVEPDRTAVPAASTVVGSPSDGLPLSTDPADQRLGQRLESVSPPTSQDALTISPDPATPPPASTSDALGHVASPAGLAQGTGSPSPVAGQTATTDASSTLSGQTKGADVPTTLAGQTATNASLDASTSVSQPSVGRGANSGGDLVNPSSHGATTTTVATTTPEVRAQDPSVAGSSIAQAAAAFQVVQVGNAPIASDVVNLIPHGGQAVPKPDGQPSAESVDDPERPPTEDSDDDDESDEADKEDDPDASADEADSTLETLTSPSVVDPTDLFDDADQDPTVLPPILGQIVNDFALMAARSAEADGSAADVDPGQVADLAAAPLPGPVPEPGTLALMLVGLASVQARRVVQGRSSRRGSSTT